MSKPKVYIVGPISTILDKREYNKIDRYSFLGKALEIAGFDTFVPHEQHMYRVDKDNSWRMDQEKKFSPKELYEEDIEELKSSDIILAFVDDYSFGVGIELLKAAEMEKDIYIICKRDVPVFVEGMFQSLEIDNYTVKRNIVRSSRIQEKIVDLISDLQERYLNEDSSS